MISISPKDIPVNKLHQYLLGSIGPRPICFASTIDSNGVRNLAPFSFFNVFSANPPIAVFSPALSGRTGEAKHTHLNVKEVPEVVINIVTYSMVQQMSLASSPYEKGVDEFIKTGFTPIDSDLIKPARVKESPVQMECKVNQVIELGKEGGAGNLIVCEILKIHIDEQYLNQDGVIDQTKIDLVARMGGNWYCRANGDALFELNKPLTTCGVGVDQLPDSIKNNSQFNGNDLGKMGNVEQLPSMELINELKQKHQGENLIEVSKHYLGKNLIMEAIAVMS